MPQPEKNLRLFLFTIFLIILATGVLAQTSLIFDVFETSGNEHFDVTSSRFGLSSCIGQPTAISEVPLTGTVYTLYPGFRKIDRDFRYPFSWFVISVHCASDTSFDIAWTGIDTTHEDGEGWGIWNYDLQYKTGVSGLWTDWFMATADTFATFGPFSPVDVSEGESYYFRIRARDRVRNVAPWGEEDSMTVNYAVEFCIHTVSPGEPTDEINHATIEYYPVEGSPVSANLWEGECLNLWCVPNEEASITRTTYGSTEEQRWSVDSDGDSSWVIDGSSDSYDIEYWHQLKPVVHLLGTDPSHMVGTLQHDQFGDDHLESDLYDLWSQWTDYGSTLEFDEFTTGSPIRRAESTDSIRFHNIIAFFTDTINYTVCGSFITVQTNFGDSIYADGVWYPSPYYTNWFDGSTHDIGIHRTVIISDCERWVFDHWSDGSTDDMRTVTISSDTVFTAIFNHQYRVEIANSMGLGTPIPSVGFYWFDEGDTATGDMDIYGVTTHILVGYIGTGSALSGGGSEFWFEVYDCSSIQWNWVPTSDDLCTLRVYSRYGHPHPVDEYVVPRGTFIWCSVEDSTFEDGGWHYNTGWLGDGVVAPASGTDNITSFTMTDNGWLVWQWDSTLQMPLVVESSPGMHGPPVPSVGTHWFIYESEVDAFVTANPDGDWWCIGYESHGAIPSTSADSVHFVLDTPTEIDWQWIDYPSGPLDTLWIFSRFDNPLPTEGMHIYPHATEIAAVVSDSDGVHYCSGHTGTGSAPSGTGMSVNFTLNMFSTLTWDWDGEDLVPLVVMNPDGWDSPSPSVGIHWFEAFSAVHAYVTSPDGAWHCVGYNGFGSVPGFGYPAFCDFMINMASGIEWLWSDDVVYLRVSAPDYSYPIPPAGITYHPVGRHIEASNIDTLYVDLTYRHVCEGWLGDGVVVPTTGTESDLEFDMTANANLNWLYDDQYWIELGFTGLPDGVEPGTLGVEGWYGFGDTAILITDSVVFHEEDPFVFVQWHDSGFGALIEDFDEESTYIVVDSTYKLIAEFREAVWVEIIKSPPGDSLGWIRINDDTVFASSFEGYLIDGFEYTAQVSPLDFNYELMFEFVSWRVDSLISDTRIIIPISDSTFYVDYNKMWHIIVEKHPDENHIGTLTIDTMVYGGGAAIRKDLWWQDGSLHRIDVSQADSNSSVRYMFMNWNDDVSTTIRIYGPVDSYDSLVALYEKQTRCRVEKVPMEPHGFIGIDGERYHDIGAIDFWHVDGTSLILEASKYDVYSDSVYTFNYWDLPGIPTDTVITLSETYGPDTFKAIYTPTKIHIEVELGQYGVYPNDSVFWAIPGTLDWAEERFMETIDSIKIYSFSNVLIELGLQVGGVFDMSDGWDADTFWSPGYYPGSNRFSLYARFNDESIPPITWSSINDYIKESPIWASSTVFGSGGYAILPGTEDDNHEMLWLKFVAPLVSDNSDHPRGIKLRLMAQIYLP